MNDNGDLYSNAFNRNTKDFAVAMDCIVDAINKTRLNEYDANMSSRVSELMKLCDTLCKMATHEMKFIDEYYKKFNVNVKNDSDIKGEDIEILAEYIYRNYLDAKEQGPLFNKSDNNIAPLRKDVGVS